MQDILNSSKKVGNDIMHFWKTKLFVPKDSGIGWTLNPNHWITWIALTALFAIAIKYSFFSN